MNARYWLVLVAFSSLQLFANDCPDDEVCFFDVKGAQCADGTDTGFAITYRKDAKDLLIYLDGGGACWSKTTCSTGAAKKLTAYGKYKGPYDSVDNVLNQGMGEAINPNAPFVKGYNLVRVPYCTGDVFIGDKEQDYGIPGMPYVIRHVGYKNLELILAEVKSRVPTADRVVFYGTSAGGIGVSWNVHQVAAQYPKSELYVVNDGGVLFKSPYVDGKKLESVYTTWGAELNHPVFGKPGHKYSSTNPLTSQVVEYNRTEFPKARYAYLSTYNDLVMMGFAGLLKASKLTTVVRSAIINLADNEFAGSSDYNVFYMNGTEHVLYKKDPDSIKSDGVILTNWMNQMLSGDTAWKSIRPDKSGP